VSEAPTKVGSGIGELDTILRGGFPRNRLVTIEGAPGTGKTTLAFQFLLDGPAKDEAGLYVTFSESRNELDEVAESHGWDFKGIRLLDLSGMSEKLRLEEQYTVFHPAEVELSETTQRIINEVEQAKPRRVVIDSLSEIRLIAREPLRYRRQILALKDIFAKYNCTVLFLEDQTSGQDMLLESIAHGVIRLEREQATYGGSRRKLQVVKMRAVDFFDGYHDFTIRRGGLNIYPRVIASHLVNAGSPRPNGMLLTQNAELDALVGSGIAWGTAMMITGPSGTGKSTLAAQIALAAARNGDRIALYLFDELKATFIARTRGLGLDFNPHLKSNVAKVTQVDPAELSPGEFAYKVCQHAEKDASRVVVIDSLNGYLNAMPDARFLTVQMHELLGYLNSRGIITILTAAQHGFVGAAEGTAFELTYLADLVILLRYFETAGSVRQAISVIKNRLAAHERTIREFAITSKGIRIGKALQEFRGVLTGIPVYEGQPGELLRKRAHGDS
jgi:circadian clock protein KaiC